MTVGSNDEDKVKGQTEIVNGNALMSPAMKWGHSAKWDDVSAQDSESFTVCPPLIEPHSNVSLCVLNKRLTHPNERQENYKLGIIEILKTRSHYDQRCR